MDVVIVAGGRRTANSKLALLILCSANLALVVAIAGGVTAVSDVLAPLTGHFMGIGLAASVALLTRRLVRTDSWYAGDVCRARLAGIGILLSAAASPGIEHD